MHFILFVKPDIESRSFKRVTGRGQGGSATNRVYQGKVNNLQKMCKNSARNFFIFADTILESDSSLWLSLDHSRLAYLTYHHANDNHDEDEDLVDDHGDLHFVVAALRVVQLSDLKTWNVTLSESFTSTKDVCLDTCHVSGVTWLTRDNILVTWLDIDKQIMIITSCSLEQASCKLVTNKTDISLNPTDTVLSPKVGSDGGYYSRHHTNGWAASPGKLLVSENRDRVAAIISTDQGLSRGFYPHLVIFR